MSLGVGMTAWTSACPDDVLAFIRSFISIPCVILTHVVLIPAPLCLAPISHMALPNEAVLVEAEH